MRSSNSSRTSQKSQKRDSIPQRVENKRKISICLLDDMPTKEHLSLAQLPKTHSPRHQRNTSDPFQKLHTMNTIKQFASNNVIIDQSQYQTFSPKIDFQVPFSTPRAEVIQKNRSQIHSDHISSFETAQKVKELIKKAGIRKGQMSKPNYIQKPTTTQKPPLFNKLLLQQL